MELQTALRRLLDKDAIRDLVASYALHADHNRWDRVTDLFVDDCVVTYERGHPLIGKEQLLAWGRHRRSWDATSHHNTDVLIAFDDADTARATVSVYAWHRDDSDQAAIWGYYFDRYRRTPDGWRFSERTLRVCSMEGFTFAAERVERRNA